MPVLLSHVFDFAGSGGVVFGLTRVVVEACFASTLLEFLLLWLVRDWWVAFQQGLSVLLLLLGARAASMVAVSLMCSRISSLLVLVEVRFPQNCVVLVSGCCGIALWLRPLLSGWLPMRCPRGLFWLVSASCCATSGLRYAAVVLAVAFWWVFPKRRLGGSSG
ncbi:hypothetical protein Taro_019337 [Colocasia esculenta]|uniref:Uncharacterized protein n=1 Tax=Colocasia esculenta TaxID=4460 RepID=A0A843UTN0_COLES|nr:hypothetical protein [Colocasia esculenta]